MQSEKEFLSHYDISRYERPSVTTDVAAFMVRSKESGNYKKNSDSVLTLLLIRRGGHPYKDCWALPGGFLTPGETVEECALREIVQETNVTPPTLLPLGTFSAPGRDPRGWIISNAFASVISEESVMASGGDDAADARWFEVRFREEENGEWSLALENGEILLSARLKKERSASGVRYAVLCGGGIAFDHASIIASALSALRACAKDLDTIFDFLPEKFTLAALQRVRETVMNTSEYPSNFRRKIIDSVEWTGEYTHGAGHRPAKLYTKKEIRK